MEDKLTFGEYLKLLIKRKGMTQAEFRRRANISKTYLVDIQKGDTYPPLKLQVRFSSILKLNQEEKSLFFDKAAEGRGELPADVFLYLMSEKDKIRELRKEIYQTGLYRQPEIPDLEKLEEEV